MKKYQFINNVRFRGRPPKKDSLQWSLLLGIGLSEMNLI